MQEPQSCIEGPFIAECNNFKNRIEGFGVHPPAQESTSRIFWRPAGVPFFQWMGPTKDTVDGLLKSMQEQFTCFNFNSAVSPWGICTREPEHIQVQCGDQCSCSRENTGCSGILEQEEDLVVPMRSSPCSGRARKGKNARWRDTIRGSCVEDDLPSFISLVKRECRDQNDELVVATLISDELLLATHEEDTRRALDIILAVVESDLLNIQKQIALECLTCLEELEIENRFGEIPRNIISQLPDVSACSYPCDRQTDHSMSLIRAFEPQDHICSMQHTVGELCTA